MDARVSAEVVGGIAYVREVLGFGGVAPVRGPLLVSVVGAKFRDVAAEPYNYSYIHDVVFGPFPSLRDFWEYVSGGAVVVRPYYVGAWLTLPKTAADYCSGGSYQFYNVASDVINLLYQRGVQLPDYSYLVIVLNAQPPCKQGAAGEGSM